MRFVETMQSTAATAAVQYKHTMRIILWIHRNYTPLYIAVQ